MKFFLMGMIFSVRFLSAGALSLDEAQEYIYSHKVRKLHLGCGEAKFKGYINLDFPLSSHTIQTKSGADLFFDITKLKLHASSIDEVRNHHLFEHFSRFDALALLCSWQVWLKEGGELVIETPDFQKSIENLVTSDKLNYEQKQLVIRHVFGSHEAHWAYHLDGWYLEKFQTILSKLGFGNFQFDQYEWNNISNITVRCEKVVTLSVEELLIRSKEILSSSLVNRSDSELKMLEVWYQGFTESLEDKVEM